MAGSSTYPWVTFRGHQVQNSQRGSSVQWPLQVSAEPITCRQGHKPPSLENAFMPLLVCHVQAPKACGLLSWSLGLHAVGYPKPPACSARAKQVLVSSRWTSMFAGSIQAAVMPALHYRAEVVPPFSHLN